MTTNNDRDADPIRELAHEHRELNELLIAVHEALARVERRPEALEDELHEIRDGVEAFRDALLVHFAREQEALLPFIITHAPDLKTRADANVIEHDRIADAITNVASAMSALDANALPAWRSTLSRFEELYAAHTKSELAFLEDVGRSLVNDPEATKQLRKLLAE